MGRYDTEAFKRAHKERLQNFIKKHRITQRPDGRLMLYKAVRLDLGSCYMRGSLGKNGVGGIYKPGAEVRCRRFSRDPYFACACGLHVATLGFARRFAGTPPVIVRVLVDPDDVVCVPIGGFEKIRTKRLYVDRIVSGKRYVTWPL